MRGHVRPSVDVLLMCRCGWNGNNYWLLVQLVGVGTDGGMGTGIVCGFMCWEWSQLSGMCTNGGCGLRGLVLHMNTGGGDCAVLFMGTCDRMHAGIRFGRS